MLPHGSYPLRWLAPIGAACALACASTHDGTTAGVEPAVSHLEDSTRAAATHELEQAGARDGNDAVASRTLGQLYRERGTIPDRLRSQMVLEAAHARHPDDDDLSMELAQTYFAQKFYPDAVRICHSVLAHDPERCDARRLLGLYHYQSWQRMNEYDDDLGDARRELRTALRCDSSDADLNLRALIAGYASGDRIDAECERLIARFPERPEFPMMRGTIAFERQRYEACARDYALALEHMDERDRAVYGSLILVLAARDDERYRAATDGMREDFQRGMWLVADPDPTTEVNPRALEHAYRLFVADCLYASELLGKRGWETDRGEAFVRFGRPIDVDYTMGEGFINGKVETWSFVTGGLFHQIVFVDEYLNGNPRIPYDADITLHFMRHSPAATTLPEDATPIPSVVDALAFRDDSMSGSIYVAMAVDADALRAVVDMKRVHTFVLRGAYFDELWQREGAFADTVRASDWYEARSARGHAIEMVRHLRVPCDRYHVAMAFEDPFGIARAVGRRDADALRFADDRLAVSDVLLFRGGDPAPGEIAIERGGTRMRPNVERQVTRGERLHAYVEIYNLALATRGTQRASIYDLRFAIFPARSETDPDWVDWGRRAIGWTGIGDDEDAVISQTFRREGRAHDDRESIAIDVDVLDDGRYELVVEVQDQRSGARAVAHAPFWKDSGAVAGRSKR